MRVTIPALAQALATPGPRALAPVARGQTALGVEAVLAAPYFPRAMVEPLREIAQDLLLPGIDKVAPDSVVGLRTNLRFIESYLVGLNHEMGRELLWRGYPTDQRGTYFDRFWGQGTPNTAPADITSLHTWGTRSLGAVLGRQSDFNRFVMLMRSSLLRRYPNAAIYLVAIVHSGGAAVLSVTGNAIPRTLNAGPDPRAAAPDPATDAAIRAGEQLPIDDGMKWMLDFTAAEDVGMGLRITIPPAVLSARIESLLVFGVADSLNATDSADQLADLFDAHHYTDGLEFLRFGTPTNNTDDRRARYSSVLASLAPSTRVAPGASPRRSFSQAKCRRGRCWCPATSTRY